jgi:ABC-2 type transport system permease protein
MRTIFSIAKKEFINLLYDRILIFILLMYIIFIIYSSYNLYTSHLTNVSKLIITDFIHNIAYDLYGYGCLIAIILGFSSIYNEICNKAMNTLLTKPVYRDTILNGKILGSLLYMCCIFLFTLLIYISLSFILFKSSFANIFLLFLNSLPLILLLCSLVFIMFYLIAMLMMIYINNYNLALLMGFFSWILISLILCSSFPYYLSLILGLNPMVLNYVNNLSPYTMLFFIFENTIDLNGLINYHLIDLFKLLLYNFILLIFCYIGFIRRDVE